ncbi:ABC transporter ATP-binding protein [Paradevosia shaoguanensis]|uniref:ABC transporter ATP-binding protein n=1 Tax=Paradevosia shaoguanensis TaxID=1335043 RepID=A0AA41QQU9_9HYPH|nr:ABC transporter ATP-binding protein [Paradevosia shaoguanensis]KFL25403.1 branched-chain amino acid ABC transporter ATPase [Devosia sp. 17-2-E-8]MCF1744863.1 ABC transporter ATP-binding protein [Paradevosia shaoguanensis]MCI0129346.1 ABC transporter ATP-binding protein [Paradevosia shaoguanensis]QMV00301.1 ATP-binding cassette domain-containing protein [Devosia sp. D6-9]
MSFDAVIDVKDVTKRFGGLRAVNKCSLRVERGSITGLIGPNGAGKSTLFNMVAGNIVPDSGTIYFDGQDITGLPPYQLFAKGLLRTFQIAHEFSHMTALENLMMVPSDQPGEDLVNVWFRPDFVRKAEHHVRQKALDVIDFLKLGHVKNELAGNLSGGQKKLLELGRTMMVDAKVVLLDEVAAGVNKTLLQDLAANIERMNQELGYTFFVIEHDMDLIGRLCDPVIVMAQGEVIAQGPMEEIRANPEIIEAYFGSPVEAA